VLARTMRTARFRCRRMECAAERGFSRAGSD
jgi:hypothetical protein